MANMVRGVAAFGILLTFASVLTVATTAAVSLTLKSVKRTLSPDKGSYIFTLHFLAPSRPEVLFEQDFYKRVFPGSVTYDDSTGHGTAEMTAARSDFGPYDSVVVSLGDLRAHYFTFKLDVDGEEDLARDIDLAAIQVDPGTDLAYTAAAGQVSELVLRVANERGNGLTCDGAPTPLNVQYYDKVQGKIVNDDQVSFYQGFQIDDGATTSTIYNFLTDQYTVNGVFSEMVKCSVPIQEKSPVGTRISEYIHLSVHEAAYTGPFPDDVVTTEFHTDDVVGCMCGGKFCYVSCTAQANNIASAVIYRVEEDGSRTVVAAGDTVREFTAYAEVNLAETGAVGGHYVCVATQNNGGPSGEDTVTVEEVTRRATVDDLRSETTEDGSAVLVTCEASGSNSLQVELRLGHKTLEVGTHGVESYTPGTCPNGGLPRPLPAWLCPWSRSSSSATPATPPLWILRTSECF